MSHPWTFPTDPAPIAASQEDIERRRIAGAYAVGAAVWSVHTTPAAVEPVREGMTR